MLKGGKGKHSIQRVPSVSPARFEERQALLDKIAAEDAARRLESEKRPLQPEIAIDDADSQGSIALIEG